MTEHTSKQRGRISRALLGSVALLAGLGTVLSGCAHPPAPARVPARPVTSGTVIDGVDTSAADSVIVAAVERIYSWNPGPDADSSAAFARASWFLDRTYLAEVGASASGLAEVPASEWARWTGEHATITAHAAITPDDGPPDTPTTRQRVVAVTQHISTPTGTEPDRPVAAYVTATDTPAGWRVSLVAPR